MWEHNEQQGAWDSEGRIQFTVTPLPFSNNLRHTAGVGRVTSRVNCNEFVENLINNHSFVVGDIQDTLAIRATIPTQYQHCFDNGYNM